VGKVWIPHQWFMWKALIGAGEMAHAERIAQTALRVWKNATDETYNLWERSTTAPVRVKGRTSLPG